MYWKGWARKRPPAMREPQYMQGDRIARMITAEITIEHECDCGALTEVACESDYSNATREVTYWGEYDCPKCKQTHNVEGWYNA